MLSGNIGLLISCEHATYAIPAKEKFWFSASQDILRSHSGWDIGAEKVASGLAGKWKAPLIKGQHSRLLIDLNRTNTHPTAFSSFSRGISDSEKKRIIENYHRPYWKQLRDAVRAVLKKSDCVLHIGVHSFTPVFQAYKRPTDLGLLFDPSRDLEFELCQKWRKEVRSISPGITAHLNRPYRGTGDGLITAFRKEFSAKRYIGVEIEMNQRLLKDAKEVRTWVNLLDKSLRATL